MYTTSVDQIHMGKTNKQRNKNVDKNNKIPLMKRNN